MPLVYNSLVFRALSKATQICPVKSQRKQILLQSDSCCLIPNLKRKRKICLRLFTSSFKRKIRKFRVVVRVKETTKKRTEKCDVGAKLLFCLLNLLLFLCSRCILNSLICLLLSDGPG